MKLSTGKNSLDTISKIFIAGFLICFAILFRMVDHPENFVPITALALFAGAIFPTKWALSLPLLAMIVSDYFIGFHDLIFLTWGCFALMVVFSSRYIKKISPKYIAIASLISSTFFFIVTNLGVWAQGRLYTMDLGGLISCYYNALPFFRNSLLGDLFYSAIIFGLYVVTYRVVFDGKYSLTLKEQSKTLSKPV